MIDVAELVVLRHALEGGPRIGDGNKMLRSLVRANRVLHQLKEVLLKDVRLKGAARFAGDDKDGFLQIQLLLESCNLGRIGRIKDMQLRSAIRFSEGLAHDFGTQAGAAHPEQRDVSKAVFFYLLSNAGQMSDVRELVFGYSKPAQPVGFIGVGP